MSRERVIIFGAKGQLGSALAERFSDADVVEVSHADVDIADAHAIREKIANVKPTVILNAAGYNSVERAEEELERAYASNAFGPYRLAEAAEENGARFVHVSTDYVFDGDGGPYTEDMDTRPLNAYGASKLAGEQLVRISGADALVIRTSSLFGFSREGGKRNFIEIMLEKGTSGKVEVVEDVRSVPTYTVDVAAAIHDLLAQKVDSGIYHVVNEGSVSWVDFASEIFSAVDLDVEVVPISTAAQISSVRRPKNSTLANQKLSRMGIEMPDWRDALRRYLERRSLAVK